MSIQRNFVFPSLAVVLVILVIVFVSLNHRRSAAREELKAVYAQIQPGDFKSDVKSLFNTNQFHYLKLRDIASNGILVQTPLEWATMNWNLWLEIQNSKVTGLRIRLHDDSDFHPIGAPADKIC